MLPQAVAHVKDYEKIMNGMITAFSESIVPRWGSLTVQNARNACRENAQRFSTYWPHTLTFRFIGPRPMQLACSLSR
jgi:hypothetical protein